MALTKVTKHIVYGSVLVAHYGQDYANTTTSSSSYVQWGENTILTPQYSDSHLEMVLTGSMFTSTNQNTSAHYGNAKFVVNGSDEYFLRGIIGAAQSIVGAHNHQNQQFGENNGRQNWFFQNFGSALYMCHVHAPGSTNAQNMQTFVMADSGGLSIVCSDGFFTVSEIAGEHYNLT